VRYVAGAIVGLWLFFTLVAWGTAELARGLIMLIRRKEKVNR
jgi:hypothetical protein